MQHLTATAVKLSAVLSGDPADGFDPAEMEAAMDDGLTDQGDRLVDKGEGLGCSDAELAGLVRAGAERRALAFAWAVCRYTKSNAIVVANEHQTVGVGAGQMSRLDSARIASIKAQHAGLSLKGSVVASDAFFPFRDGLDVVVDAGAACVIQPGGSMRDDEVIADSALTHAGEIRHAPTRTLLEGDAS